jgi:hypothetical protein
MQQIIPMTIILGKCKELTRNMVAMCGVRLRQLTSRMISILLFKELGAWAICNAKMMSMIFFLNKCKKETTWSGKDVHNLRRDCLFSIHLFTNSIICNNTFCVL